MACLTLLGRLLRSDLPRHRLMITGAGLSAERRVCCVSRAKACLPCGSSLGGRAGQSLDDDHLGKASDSRGTIEDARLLDHATPHDNRLQEVKEAVAALTRRALAPCPPASTRPSMPRITVL